MLTLLLLFLLEEINDEVLVLSNELVVETLCSQVVSEVLPPMRIERLQRCEFRGRFVPVGAPRSRMGKRRREVGSR